MINERQEIKFFMYVSDLISYRVCEVLFYVGKYILIIYSFIADGYLQAWTDWLSCSVSCGGGKRHRFRHCHPQPMNGGVCVDDGEKRMEAEDCNTDECPRKYDGKVVFLLNLLVSKCT